MKLHTISIVCLCKHTRQHTHTQEMESLNNCLLWPYYSVLTTPLSLSLSLFNKFPMFFPTLWLVFLFPFGIFFMERCNKCEWNTSGVAENQLFEKKRCFHRPHGIGFPTKNHLCAQTGFQICDARLVFQVLIIVEVHANAPPLMGPVTERNGKDK